MHFLKRLRVFFVASVKVTLLQWVNEIKGLVVGFNFGGWQVWRLTDLRLV